MRIKLFYGWYIVAAGLVLSAYNSWVFAYGWTAFINPILATFGWSMTQIALASSLRGLETGLFNPVWGAAVDRWSARKLMPFGVITTALGVFCLSQTTNLARYYVGFFIGGMGGSLITGTLPVTVIARWFRRDIGKATGLYYTSMAIGGILVPVMVTIIDRLGWQTTLLYAGIGYLALGIPLSFVFRSWPAEYGLLPDGKSLDSTQGSKRASDNDFGTSVKEALKMRAFWHLVVVALFQNAYLGPLQTFTMPYLSSLGMARAAAATVIIAYNTASLLSRMPMGFLSDIFRRSYVVAISVGLQTIGLLIFWLMDGRSPFWLIIAFGITYGVGIAGIMALRVPILTDYFGRKNFGTIFGLTSIFITIAGVVSPTLAGWVYDTRHDYKPFWLVGVAFGILALIAILTIPPATKRVK